ncbi:hypothetical protein GGR56DRAFT_689171 [Xylariaceae sp. FL0804]|nr:hypothetical protein GGR56DRAFT_689171 [Xylariaceae sp. FL0804]
MTTASTVLTAIRLNTLYIYHNSTFSSKTKSCHQDNPIQQQQSVSKVARHQQPSHITKPTANRSTTKMPDKKNLQGAASPAEQSSQPARQNAASPPGHHVHYGPASFPTRYSPRVIRGSRPGSITFILTPPSPSSGASEVDGLNPHHHHHHHHHHHSATSGAVDWDWAANMPVRDPPTRRPNHLQLHYHHLRHPHRHEQPQHPQEQQQQQSQQPTHRDCAARVALGCLLATRGRELPRPRSQDQGWRRSHQSQSQSRSLERGGRLPPGTYPAGLYCRAPSPSPHVLRGGNGGGVGENGDDEDDNNEEDEDDEEDKPATNGADNGGDSGRRRGHLGFPKLKGHIKKMFSSDK